MTIQSQAIRRATSSPAQVICKDGTSLACIVKNVSVGGARIELSADAVMPDDIHLMANDLKIDRGARVVWRMGLAMGVQFVVKLPPTTIPRADRWLSPASRGVGHAGGPRAAAQPVLYRPALIPAHLKGWPFRSPGGVDVGVRTGARRLLAGNRNRPSATLS